MSSSSSSSSSSRSSTGTIGVAVVATLAVFRAAVPARAFGHLVYLVIVGCLFYGFLGILRLRLVLTSSASLHT